MISQNALRHAEKCRFCWMCRHVCPVQRQTGREINTPRAKGLLLSMARKGARPFDRDMAQAMYECLLCEACTNDCATGYRPPLFIREARTEAVVSETAPSGVMKLNRQRAGAWKYLRRGAALLWPGRHGYSAVHRRGGRRKGA